MRLSKAQQSIVKSDIRGATFLEGPAGTGKTITGVRRLLYLLESGVPAGTVLLLVPQRALAFPYETALRKQKQAAGGRAAVFTMGSLALHMVDLFWPLVAEEAGFRQPDKRPTFLSLETAQYYMMRVIGPVIDQNGYFDTISIDRSRLYSQLIDNLNKAAVVGFPYSEIGERLKSAWVGDSTQKRIYDEVQDCVNRFRAYCLEHNLLDFSLQVELFVNRLWSMPPCRGYLTSRYKHLLVDNVEEDNPATHRLLRQWLPDCDSALLIYDHDAGYRRFLGSDADSAYTLKPQCENQVTFTKSYVVSPELDTLGVELGRSFKPDIPEADGKADPRAALVYGDHRYHPQMVDWVADEITRLIREQGIPAREIVVLAPFLSDALRFALMNRLDGRGIPVRSHRPSRALREEPAAQCLLTLAQIAHPAWKMRPTSFDVAYALMEAIDGLDLVRAQLLEKIVHRTRDGASTLTPFENIQPDVQERVTFTLGEHYETLRQWIENYKIESSSELDFFFSRLFGEVLSQAGFGFHRDFDAAAAAANLIDSARNFRWTVSDLERPAGQEYVEMVRSGVIADQYLRSWQLPSEDAVLLAPAYTFLMSNQPVDYQFWLNVGSAGWAERLYQPLTHPYVLSLGWLAGNVWTDSDEFGARQEALYRLVRGLVRRCRKTIYLGFSQLGEQGYEQRGPLLESVQRMLRRLSREAASGV